MSLLERQNTAKRREKPLVQAVEFFENTGPVGCHFIFPESDFDPSNSIGSRNMSVLMSTLIGLATENSSNRFSILLSTLFPWPLVIIETLQSPGNQGFEGRKSSVGSTVFLYASAKIQLWNLASKFQI